MMWIINKFIIKIEYYYILILNLYIIEYYIFALGVVVAIHMYSKNNLTVRRVQKLERKSSINKLVHGATHANKLARHVIDETKLSHFWVCFHYALLWYLDAVCLMDTFSDNNWQEFIDVWGISRYRLCMLKRDFQDAVQNFPVNFFEKVSGLSTSYPQLIDSFVHIYNKLVKHISRYPLFLQFVPDVLQTNELIYNALYTNPYYMYMISDEKITNSLVKFVFSLKNPDCLIHMSPQLIQRFSTEIMETFLQTLSVEEIFWKYYNVGRFMISEIRSTIQKMLSHYLYTVVSDITMYYLLRL